jgi:hypothetical protein
MIFAVIASLISAMYPWNIETGAYRTTGEWTNEQVYSAYSAYVELDRWKKDYMVVRWHDLEIDEDWYQQTTYSVSGYRWWSDQIRTGSDYGVFMSKRDGWFVGGRMEGVVGWLGYSAVYHYLSLGKQIFVPYSSPIQHSHTATFLLRHQFGPFLVSPGVQASAPENRETDLQPVLWISGWISNNLFISLGHGFGDRRFLVDPYSLTVDLNRDLTVAWYEVAVSFRISPNWYAHTQYSRADLEPVGNQWPYTAHYMTFGLNLRY